jgi:hypothetical protein
MLEEVWHILKADFNQIDITYDLLKDYIYIFIPLPFLITYLIIVISIKKRIPQPHMHAGSRNRGNQKPSIEGEQAMHAQKIKRFVPSNILICRF